MDLICIIVSVMRNVGIGIHTNLLRQKLKKKLKLNHYLL